jgi:hypothetical protein
MQIDWHKKIINIAMELFVCLKIETEQFIHFYRDSHRANTNIGPEANLA